MMQAMPGSGLCCALSRAVHTSEMLLWVFSFLIVQHVLQRLFSMAASLGTKAEVPSRVYSAPKICDPDANRSAVPISRGGASGPPMRPQCHPTSQWLNAQALALLLPPSVPHPHAETLVGGQSPLPRVRTEKSPPGAAWDVALFFLGIRKLEHGRDFSPQPDLQTLSKVNRFAL